METGPTPVEDNAATQYTGSNIVQINSIYIDLKFPPEKNEIHCRDHNFSIRGYAAEMRKKNLRASMPFPNASLNNIEEQLPPMYVPKFRWWCCLECRKKIEDASDVEGTPVHSTCCTHSTPSNVPSHADAIVTPSETQPPPLAQLSESIRNVDINAPPNHQEPNYAETEDVSASGGDAGPVGLIIDKAGPTRDEETNSETGNVITAGDSNGITEQEDNDGSTREIHSEFQQPALGSSTNAKQIRFRLIPYRTDAIHNAVDVAAAETVNSSGVAPMLVEESGNASTGSEQNKRHENASGVSRRRRKVRSLTELLGDKGKLRSDVLKEDVPSIHPKVVPASGSVTVLSQDQTPHENIGSGNKSPQRKRKMPQEEPEGNIDPHIAGPGGSISKAVSGRKVTDNATCSSEAQANASSAVRLQIANINAHFNRKAEKTSVLVKRKDKQIQVHDRFSPRPGEQSSSKNRTKGGNLHIANDNTLSRSLGTSSAAGEMDNHSRNFQSPQVPDREKGQCASLISKSQPSHLKVGLDLSLNSFARKNVSSGNKEISSSSKSIREKNDLHFGQCSSLRAPEPDRLPKKSQDWDLNESVARNSNNSVEKRNSSLTKKTRCQKEKISEVEGHPQEINRQSDNMGSYRMGQGSPDDIPMEIVELMAKNQYERGLPDVGTNSVKHRIPNSMGRFSDVQGTGTIMFTKEFPALTSFSTDTRSGLAMTGNAINYPQMNRNNFEIFNPEKSKMSIFDMFPHQQIFSRGMQGPASASVSTGSQRSERAEIIASSAAPNMSFGLGIQQNISAQSHQLQHRGKTISDIKADEMKKRQEAHIILSRLGNSQLRIEPKGAVDPYANDNIPAMQLLSLMNGTSPGTTFNIGSSKPFAPCGYHPRYSTTERRDMLSGPLFQRQSRLGTGTFSVGESSGRSPGQRPFAFPSPQEENQSYLARYTSGIPYTGPTSTRGKPKETANVGASDSIPYLQQHLGRRLVSLENGSITEEVQQLRLIPREEQNCVTNQNPAEFILPDSEAFTICWKDLKIPKRKYPRGDPGDGVKRPRVAKPKQGRSNH